MIRVEYDMDKDGRSFSICVERDDPAEGSHLEVPFRMYGHGAVPKECPPEHQIRETVRTMTSLVNGCLAELKL